MRTPTDLTNDELEDMIVKLEDRIETTREFLSDEEDASTIGVLRQRLALYSNQFLQCKKERAKR
jgi:hypothetical protein